MVGDELRIERLGRRERLAVAAITGIAENVTLHRGQTLEEAVTAIEVELTGLDRGLILSHSAARYLGGEHPYEADCVTLLERAGADLNLALDIAIHRTGLPVTNIGNTARRARLLAIRDQPA